MDRVIGGVLGLCAGIAVVAVSVTRGVPASQALWRATIAVLLGYWIGRLIFGPAGLSVVKEAAGPVPPESPPAVETKPQAPGAPPGPKAK